MPSLVPQRRLYLAAIGWLLAAAFLPGAVGIAAAQSQSSPATPGAAAPEAQAPAAVFPPQPQAVEHPGFVHTLGHWWEGSRNYFDAKMKDARERFESINSKSNNVAKSAAAATQEAMQSAATATRGAATAIVRLPSTRVIEMNARCPAAANGAPDCPMAVASACRAKGFNGGQPIDISSRQECPPASARGAADDDCPVETIVLRAVCQ